MRTKQLNIRVSDEEAARFERVANHYGISIAQAVRMLMKQEDDRRGAARLGEARRGTARPG